MNMHPHPDCTCDECRLIRVVYALIASRDVIEGDREWAITILAHHNTMGKIDG